MQALKKSADAAAANLAGGNNVAGADDALAAIKAAI